jgi:hypothetical protein
LFFSFTLLHSNGVVGFVYMFVFANAENLLLIM